MIAHVSDGFVVVDAFCHELKFLDEGFLEGVGGREWGVRGGGRGN